MQAFLMSLTQILEKNPKVLWGVIAGVVGCLMLYVAEIVNIQNLLVHLDSADATRLRTVLAPIAQRYQWARIIWGCLAVLWVIWQYLRTKKILNLS